MKALVLGSTTTCSLSILAVGAGGQGSCSTGGGGGSGFVEMTTINVENMDELAVFVGGASNFSESPISRSWVEIQGIEVIVAEAGDQGESFLNSSDTSRSTPCSGPSGSGAGGRGFSGGGGFGGYHGGFGGIRGRDGSDGEDRGGAAFAKGGEGSGISLEDFNFPNFTLR